VSWLFIIYTYLHSSLGHLTFVQFDIGFFYPPFHNQFFYCKRKAINPILFHLRLQNVVPLSHLKDHCIIVLKMFHGCSPNIRAMLLTKDAHAPIVVIKMQCWVVIITFEFACFVSYKGWNHTKGEPLFTKKGDV
jgi:hypothetical protein